MLKRNAIEPAPERSKHTPWSTFLKAHWKSFAASDFFTVEAWTWRGLVTHYVLLVISIVGRVVRIAGITIRPDEACMRPIARNVVDEDNGVLTGKKYLVLDRDTSTAASPAPGCAFEPRFPHSRSRGMPRDQTAADRRSECRTHERVPALARTGFERFVIPHAGTAPRPQCTIDAPLLSLDQVSKTFAGAGV